MVSKNPMDAVKASKRKRTATPKKTDSVRASRTKTSAGRKKAERGKKGKSGIWKETPRWLIWTITAFIAVLYLFYIYNNELKPYFYRWDFGNTYRGRPVVHGIDISHHQGEINWKDLAKAEEQGSGIHFVFMKATEGSDWQDSTFQKNFEEARKYGFIRGAYHFFSNTSPAEKQADFFCSQVKLMPNDLPPVLDVETKGKYGEDSLRIEVKNWLRKVEAHFGIKPIIYASRKFKERYLTDSVLDSYPFWIAHYYVDSLTYDGEWAFWQHTDRGRLPGIKGRVDMNVYNGSLESLKKLTLAADTLVSAK